MKTLGLLAGALLILPGLLMAGEKGKACHGDAIEIRQGVLIDNMCATAHKDELEAFTATHTKECALMPDCAKSGYSFYSEGTLYKLDAKAQKKVGKYLKAKDATLDVNICGTLKDGTITVRDICARGSESCPAGKKKDGAKKGCCPSDK